MSAAVVALVAALDGVKPLDACSREEKIATARKILDKAPTSLLPVELADRIGRASSKLAAKLEREPMPNLRRLAYLGAIVVAAEEAPPKTTPAPDATKAENEFSRHAVREIAAMRAEYLATTTPAERTAFRARIDAIEHWRRNRAKGEPTPHWALQGYDSPSDYAARRAPPKKKAPIPNAEQRRGNMELGAILDPVLNDDMADVPPIPDEDEQAAAAGGY